VIQAAVVPSSLPMHKVGKGGTGVHAGEMRRIVGGVGDVQVCNCCLLVHSDAKVANRNGDRS
jgi:hypothetical protein